MRSAVVAIAIALAALLAGSCEANLEGARCPCIVPDYTCVENVCRPTGDAGGPDPDGGFPDAGFVPDAGFFPDAGF